MDALDRHITREPDDARTIDATDWNGEELVIGSVYIDFDGTWVHEDEKWDYIDDTFRKVEVEEGDQL